MKLTLTTILFLTVHLLFSQIGELDTSFGTDGFTISEIVQIPDNSVDIATQSDGKIVLVGHKSRSANPRIVVVRYLENGQLDTEFAEDGVFMTNMSKFDDTSFGVAVDDTNNIFITGNTNDTFFSAKGYVIKLSKEGVIDSTFAENGIWVNPVPDSDDDFREILLQNDGKILIAGKTRIDHEPTFTTVIRFNVDGTLDDTFGINGTAKIEAPKRYEPQFAILTENEEIITGGEYLLSVIGEQIALSKFTNQGEVDLTFGENGIVLDNSPLIEAALDIALQSDGKIVLATGKNITASSPFNFGMARFNQDGTLDNSFGNNGRVSTVFSGANSLALSVVVQEDDKIILSGIVNNGSNANYAIARYDSVGQLDTSFGIDGKTISDLGFSDIAFVSTLHTDGNLLCAGTSRDLLSHSYSIARYITRVETNVSNVSDDISRMDIIPNPSEGEFSLSFDLKQSGKATIDILDFSGKLLYTIREEEFFIEGKNNINIRLDNKLVSGLYLVRIETERGVLSRKFVVAR